MVIIRWQQLTDCQKMENDVEVIPTNPKSPTTTKLTLISLPPQPIINIMNDQQDVNNQKNKTKIKLITKKTTKEQRIKKLKAIKMQQLKKTNAEPQIQTIEKEQPIQQDNFEPIHQEEDQRPSWYFSQYKFSEFDLSKATLKALQENKWERMTHIQARTLPYLLKGRDILGAAKTGSGKTLAFLIPSIQLLNRFQFSQRNGTGVIVITPTRQLAIQIFEVAKKLLSHHNKTVGLLIGGANRKAEAIRLEKGVNLLICTPGRLLDHLHNSKFVYRNLLSLVIDEADAILKIGFEQEMNEILKVLPTDRQTILFSATQTKKVDSLARLSLKQPIYLGVDDIAPTATVQNLQQGYVVLSADKKFQLLFTFLQKNKNKKVMVFFSTCNSVKFHSDLFNYVDLPVMDIHGRQTQQKRSATFRDFNNKQTGILLCTDVAARGLDIPEVDWIVQYDPPDDTKEYIHRVGRTCRGYQAQGRALLFLLDEEKGYLDYLAGSKVQLNEYQFDMNKLAPIQEQYEKLVQKNYYLKKSAFQAYKSYLHSYSVHGLKDIFNVNKLDLNQVARSFGFTKPPIVDLNIKVGRSHNRPRNNNNHGLLYGRPQN